MGGLLFVLTFAVHGSLWVLTRSEGVLHERAAKTARILYVPLAIVAVAFLVATWWATPLWQNVLAKPYLTVLPLLAVVGLVGERVFVFQRAYYKAWFASSAFIVGAVLFGVAGLYPNLLPSSLDAEASQSVFNASSSPLTLAIMLGIVLCFLPIVIGYQVWVYAKFRDSINAKSIEEGPAY